MYLAVDSPSATTVSAWYIGAVIALVLCGSIWDRRKPYSQASARFAHDETIRIQTAMSRRLDTLADLTPRQVEAALAKLYEQQDWHVELTPASSDGGKDLVLRRDGVTVFVEVKQFQADHKVGRPLIMKLHSAVVHERADAGIFVTTSSYTMPAREFAALNEIKLVDGAELSLMLMSAYPVVDESIQLRVMCPTCAGIVSLIDPSVAVLKCDDGHAIDNPMSRIRNDKGQLCEQCQVHMVRVRIQGSRYWNYKCPRCRKGTRLSP